MQHSLSAYHITLKVKVLYFNVSISSKLYNYNKDTMTTTAIDYVIKTI